MPPKSRSKKAKSSTRELTRTALLREYCISDKTFRRVETLQLMDLPMKAGCGRVVYEIDQTADRILHMARNCPNSFTPFRPPALRFIMLGFLTMTDEDIIDGLENRGLSNRAITLEYLAQARRHFNSNVPALIKDIVANQDAPESEVEDGCYNDLLQITGVLAPYENPLELESYYFSSDEMKDFINQIVWAQSASDAQRARILNHEAGYDAMEPGGLTWYRLMFHDNRFMRTSDQSKYFGGLSPRTRHAYKASMTMTVEELVVEAGMAHDSVLELVHMGRGLRRAIRQHMNSAEPDALETASRMITTVVKIDDHIGKIRTDGTGKTPAHVQEMTPAQYDFEDEFRIPPELDARNNGEDTNAG